MNIEELAFKDRKELANLNELDLLETIEFLQLDRKQWINQYSTAHNDYVDLQQENKQLKIQISAREEVCNRLESNWNKLKKYIRKNIIYDDVGMKILDPSPLEDYIQELEQGSDNQ